MGSYHPQIRLQQLQPPAAGISSYRDPAVLLQGIVRLDVGEVSQVTDPLPARHARLLPAAVCLPSSHH